MNLHHYTGQRGLVGIVQSGSMWASSIAHLNDRSEFSHALDLVRTKLQAAKGEVSESLGRLLDLTETVVCEARAPHSLPFVFRTPFVASLSEEPDLLSQWRGYCAGGTGFSIGLDYDLLKESVERFDCELVQCIYDDQAKNNLIGVSLNRLIESLKPVCDAQESPEVRDTRNAVLFSFRQEIFSLAPRFKHLSFAEEKEWRITRIRQEMIDDDIDLEFREGNPGPVPFIQIPIRDSAGKIPIRVVVLSPGADIACNHSVMALCSRKTTDGSFQVMPSVVPLRVGR